MKRKIVGIFVMTLLIGTSLQTVISMSKNIIPNDTDFNFEDNLSTITAAGGLSFKANEKTRFDGTIFYETSSFKHLIVSPNFSRKSFKRLIKNEIHNAQEGKEASVFLKLNNLVDTQLIDLLYAASNAGVKIRLIVRGMCSIVPGIKGQSDNIEAISIVDKFLEHTRIYIFSNDGDPKYYLSSADLMPRNLDRRVEVTCPIYDAALKEQLQNYMEIQWQDNLRARIISSGQNNNFRPKGESGEVRAQWAIYNMLSKLEC